MSEAPDLDDFFAKKDRKKTKKKFPATPTELAKKEVVSTKIEAGSSTLSGGEIVGRGISTIPRCSAFIWS